MPASSTRRVADRPFHPLPVAAVEPVCADATAVTFEVPPALAERFRFAPGQWITVRRSVDGCEQRRSYSICSPAGGPLRIGVRAIEGGAVSGWLAGQVAVGDCVEVQPPSGTFTARPAEPAFHVLVAAGSGITPMLSIASSVLAHAASRVVLMYGNRRADSVMFADDIADLKDEHLDRFQVMHVLSREDHEVDLLSGRIDGAKFTQLLGLVGPVDAVDQWWLCGPYAMVESVSGALERLDVPLARVRRELFYVEEQAPPPTAHDEPGVSGGSTVTFVVDGRSTTTSVGQGVSVLDGALASRADLPFACKGGVCGTCRAKVTVGTVRMRRNFALDPTEIAAGFVLTCQSFPSSDEVVVDFDA